MKGVLIGSHELIGNGWLTGTTVVLVPDGATGGVDVRGGGPGTHETDLLAPHNAVEKVHAVTLTGGSSYGLASIGGVMDWLAEREIGHSVGGKAHEVVPIVPGAVIFDLGRGREFNKRPTAAFGYRACEAAVEGPVRTGNVGAGAGAVAGGLKGGLGHAVTTLADGCEVEVVVAVNSVGSCVCRTTGRLYGSDPADLRVALPEEISALPQPHSMPLATTIGVVLTNTTLTKAQAQKVSGIAHDGMARAIRPVHTMFDGDSVFTLATGALPAPDQQQFHALLTAAADTFERAIVNAILSAESVGPFTSYRDAVPSLAAFPG